MGRSQFTAAAGATARGCAAWGAAHSVISVQEGGGGGGEEDTTGAFR
jgi:hypothetical protein